MPKIIDSMKWKCLAKVGIDKYCTRERGAEDNCILDFRLKKFTRLLAGDGARKVSTTQPWRLHSYLVFFMVLTLNCCSTDQIVCIKFQSTINNAKESLNCYPTCSTAVGKGRRSESVSNVITVCTLYN